MNYIKKSNKKTVAIGITAFNEQSNISNLLRLIKNQKVKSAKLKEIVLISDGSTDNTVKKAKEIKNKKIKIISENKRKGKLQRLNQLFNILNTDFLIILDADILLKSENTIENLIQPLIINDNIKLSSGLATPLKAKTFIERAVNSSVQAYLNLLFKLNSLDSPFLWEGRIFALSKDFYKKITLPKNCFDELYIYFLSKKEKVNFLFVPSAAVYYRSPSTIKDQIKQNNRYVSRMKDLSKFFGREINSSFNIPKVLFYKTLLTQFFHDPIHCLAIVIINNYGKHFVSKNNATNRIWDISETTKGGITDEI